MEAIREIREIDIERRLLPPHIQVKAEETDGTIQLEPMAKGEEGESRLFEGIQGGMSYPKSSHSATPIIWDRLPVFMFEVNEGSWFWIICCEGARWMDLELVSGCHETRSSQDHAVDTANVYGRGVISGVDCGVEENIAEELIVPLEETLADDYLVNDLGQARAFEQIENSGYRIRKGVRDKPLGQYDEFLEDSIEQREGGAGRQIRISLVT
ncbi:hypothetical protein P691DRAFT_781704 [Macrolepiota fuliginosa MF-IS2]|uniref:Uncharacterized protein n=1 Tax=Macrolepiota fuliginosa MF-IS2 TaxID=1400762 RepID=A0A9P6C8S5_9AGAR|nr:hypothetical protein P691DRAFT_781704 [Macrolepiota fuliginosa MF-IS2]